MPRTQSVNGPCSVSLLMVLLCALGAGVPPTRSPSSTLGRDVDGCRDFKPTRQRLQDVGDSLVKLGATKRVVLSAGDSIGVYAALDTGGTVVDYGARVWRADFAGTALTDVLPSVVGKQIPISGIKMLYEGRPMPDGRYAVLQWGLLCAY